MSAGAVAVVIAASICFACCAVLVLHRQYHDGLIGRFGLTLIALAAAARVMQLCMEAFNGLESVLAKPNCILWIGVAMFLARHTYNFLRRWHKQNGTWYPAPGRKARGT